MASHKKVFLAGLFGNALEWYDFILYAHFASIIALLYFPSKDPLVSLGLTFSAFAAGFLVRPRADEDTWQARSNDTRRCCAVRIFRSSSTGSRSAKSSGRSARVTSVVRGSSSNR